jgi:hypothetical protein
VGIEVVVPVSNLPYCLSPLEIFLIDTENHERKLKFLNSSKTVDINIALPFDFIKC